MKKGLQFLGLLIGMHLLGSAFFFLMISGPKSLLVVPLLSVYGSYVIMPEICVLWLIWGLYEPYGRRADAMLPLWCLIYGIPGGLLAALLVPKNPTWPLIGFGAGFIATTFALGATHLLKTRTHWQD